MKKLSLYIFLCLLWCNVGFGEEPKWDFGDLNKNVIEYGWKIKSSKMTKVDKLPLEIYTLTKGNWVLKCQILYIPEEVSRTWCNTP